MITKFKIFENDNNSDYLINKLSEECLLKLGFTISYKGYYHLNLKDYKIFDDLFIYDNKIYLGEFKFSRFLIDDDIAKTTKIYIDKYLEYYDYIKSNVFKKYVLLSFYDNTFIPKAEYAKIIEKEYIKNSEEYMYKLNDSSIVKYKEQFDKVIDLIRTLEGSDSECQKHFKVKEFNI